MDEDKVENKNDGLTSMSFLKTSYEYSSGKISEICRQMSLAGIAIIWIFKVTKETLICIDQHLLKASFLFILVLIFDLLQYSFQYTAYFYIHRNNEKRKGLKDEDRITLPFWPVCIANFLLTFKALMCFLGYIFLLLYIFPKLKIL